MPSELPSQQVVRRWGAGTAAIARLLIASDRPMTGVAIATAVGVTQPRASQVLKQLANRTAVRATPDGYVGDPKLLLDLYRTRSRPHLVRPEFYCYGTRSLPDQARQLVTVTADHEITLAFSADLGPDLLVPWRHPTVTVAYVDGLVPVEATGLVPAEGRADATLILRLTDDRSLLSPPLRRREIDGFPLTDPCQQWWDLLDLGGEDRVEAATRLQHAIVDRALPPAR